jgi:flavorubredoxin
MSTRLDEIADQIYCVSTFVPQIGPRGFSFNQILVNADEPLLFHCGTRALFPAVRDAVARVLRPDRLRWISFSHVEADECGAMNLWLETAPQATVVQGQVGCMVSLNDLADRMPRALQDDELLELGNRKIRLLATPQVPHNWEAIALFEETTATLLAGDILASDGAGPAMTSDDVTEHVLDSERMFRAHALGPSTRAILNRLAALHPRAIASMHGSGFEGDCEGVLRRIGAGLEAMAFDLAEDQPPSVTAPARAGAARPTAH